MLLTTHYMEEAEQLCDRLLLLDGGRVVTEGTPPDLIIKHVGSEVIELRSTSRTAKELRTQLGLDSSDAELSADTLYIFLREPGAVPDAVRRAEGVEFLHRRATLEDVFLRLTGRELSE